jgi:hypothetical protein
VIARSTATGACSATGAWRGVHAPSLNGPLRWGGQVRGGPVKLAKGKGPRAHTVAPSLTQPVAAEFGALPSMRAVLRSAGTFVREKPAAVAFIIGPTKAMLCDTFVQYYLEEKKELDRKRTL